MNNRPTHSVVLLLAAMLLTFGTLLPFPVAAHEGENHGASLSTTAAPAETLLAVSGSGSLFEAILKYHPFAPDETVVVTLYLVSVKTNRPIADAAISASLSEGERTTTVSFTPEAGGPVGAYSATVVPTTTAPMSWLFDVTADNDADLIGVTGFQTSPHESALAVGQTLSHDSDWTVLSQRAVLVTIGILLLIAAFATGRMTAHKGVST